VKASSGKITVEEHGDVFFFLMPLTWGISVPLQTLRTSNSSLSSRANVGVRWFEAAYRLVFVWPALARLSWSILGKP
jgi:hypothetical protein